MTNRFDPVDHHVRTNGGKGWKDVSLPFGIRIPRPTHSKDGDSLWRVMRTLTPVPQSAAIMAHLRRTLTIDSTGDGKPDHRFVISTGDAVPDFRGATENTYLNQARAKDPIFTVAKDDGPKNLNVTVYRDAATPWGAKVRIGDHMFPQGWPMHEYADHKVHIYDDIDPKNRTITEIQWVVDVRRNPILNWFLGLFGKGGGYQCHGVKQWNIDTTTSTEVWGSSAAGLSIAEANHRFQDFTMGWKHATTMGIPFARRGRFVYPAKATDGKSDDADAMELGMLLRMTEAAYKRLSAKAGPQSQYLLDCYYEFGIVLVDTSLNITWGPEPDPAWDQADLQATLKDVSLDDFTVWQMQKPAA